MKKALLLIVLLSGTTLAFSQSKDEKPMRKIASGKGVEEAVREAMEEVRIELEDLDIEIDEEIQEALREVRDLDIDIDIDVDRIVEEALREVEIEIKNLDVKVDVKPRVRVRIP